MNKPYGVLLTLLCVMLFGMTAWGQAPSPVPGDKASHSSGNWGTGATWDSLAADGVTWLPATQQPGSTANVFILTGHTVTYNVSSQNCKSLVVQSGATLQSNLTLPSTQVLKVNGPTLWVDGTFGSSATDGLSIETKYNAGPITIGGSGTINMGLLRPNSSQADPLQLIFAANVTFNYAGSSGTGGSGVYLTGRGLQKNVTVTINAGSTLQFGALSNFSLTSGSSSYGNANFTLNVNGTLNIPGGNLTLADSAAYTCAVNVGGTGIVSVGKNFTPYLPGSGITAINVASGGAFNILSGGTADFSNPSTAVTGAGTFALQAGGTINVGAGAGLDALSGPVQTTTATFDPGANYSYVGTGAQVLGAQLPDSMNNLTVGSTSTLTIGVAKKVKGALQINGWLVNNGGLNSAGTATVNGTYQHNDTAVAGPMPIATWNTGSLCLVTVLNTLATGGIPNGGQNFYNYKVDCPTLVGAGRLGMKNATISGNLIIHNTNDPTGAAANMVVLAPKGGPPNDTSIVTVLGNLLIDSSAATLSLGYGSTAQRAQLIVQGNINSKGVLYGNGSGISSIFYVYGDVVIQATGANAFRGHSSAVYPDSVVFCGTGIQRFIKPIALASMGNLRFLVKSGSTLVLDDTTVVTYGSTIGTFAVADGATLKLGHPSGLNGNLSSSIPPTLSSNANYEFNGGAAQVTGKRLPVAVNNLTINNSFGVGLDTSTAVNGTLTLANGALSIGANTLTINGALTRTAGSLTGGPTSNMVIGGSGSGITIPGSVGSLNGLTLNNANGAALGGNLTLAGPLTFTNGKLTTAAYTLTIDTAGSVSGAGAGKYVNGNLAKTYTTGPHSFTYTVGDASLYAPVAVSFATVNAGGTVTGKTTAGDHPNIATSGVDAAKSVNRYWTLTNNGLGFDQYDAVFSFDPTDIDAGADTAQFLVKKFDTGVWSAPVTGIKTPVSTQATGMTSMSDFVVGMVAPPTIAVTGTLTDFGLVGTGAASAEQQYSVAGANLQGDILITAPAEFQVSTTSGSGFGPSVTLTQTGGTVSSTVIYVRFTPGSLGAKSGNIAHTSTNAATVDKAVSGTGISAEPATQASAVHFTGITPVSVTVNWTNGSGSDRIVLARAGSAVNADPSDGATYTADAAFGVGSQIGTGNYVVYIGSGNSVNVTGLSIGAPYHFAVYEFNGAAGTQNYLVPGAVGDQMTAHEVIFSNGTGGGVWTDASTWQGGIVPGPFDSAVVRATDSVSVTANTTITGLNILAGGKLAASAKFSPVNTILGGTLFVSADTLNPTAMAVNGRLSLTGGTVALAGSALLTIQSGGTADFTNPTATVTGAGNFDLQAGATINIGAGAGLDAVSGPIRTATASFDTAANYSYVGTGAQQLGAQLPDSVNNLTVGSTSKLTIAAAKRVEGALQVDGWLVNSGGLTSAGTATVNGTYQHNDTAVTGRMPIATWNTGSMCLVTALNPAATGGITNGSQNFYHYKVDCPTLAGSARLGIRDITIRGNLIIHNTNDPTGNATNYVAITPRGTSPAGGPPTDVATITVLGDLLIDSSSATLSIGSGSNSYPQTGVLKVHGNISSKGVLYGNGSGVSNIFYAYGDINIMASGSNAFRGHSAALYPDSVIFCGTGVQKFTKPTTLATTSNLRYRVLAGSTLVLNDTTVVPYGGSLPGSFTVDAGATLKIGHPNGVNGNLAPQAGAPAPILSSGATYEFNSGSAQMTGASLPASVTNLTINNPLNVTLSGNVSVTGTLALTAGKLATGASVVGIATSGSISGVDAGKYINGNLKKTLNSGADTKTFEIGDATTYAPVEVSGASYAAPFDLTAKTTSGDHPDSLNAPILAGKSVNRYYTLTGTPTGLSSVTFNFAAGDVDAGANASRFIVGQFDTSRWGLAPVTGQTATSMTATAAHFSDFVIGEMGAVSISGTIMIGTTPMQDVTVTASGGFSGSVLTDVNGAFTIPGVPFGTTGIILTPAKTGFVFTPATLPVDSITGYVTGKDFTGAVATFTLTVNVAGNGTVVKTPDQLLYDYGTTVLMEATPSDRSWKFQGWSGDATGTTDTASVLMTTNRIVTATFVEDPLYTAKYRSFRPDSIGMSVDNKGKPYKFVARKPVAVDFSTTLVSPARPNTGLLVKASMLSTGVVKNAADSVIGGWTNAKTATILGVDTNQTITITGRGFSGKIMKLTYVWSHAVKPTTTKGTAVVTSILRLPMPNRINVLAEAMAQGGFGTNGLVVGQIQPDVKHYGWFQTLKYGDVMKTIVSKGGMHTGNPHGFDLYVSGKPVVKANKSLTPEKYNNRLLANMIALKLSIVASAMQKTPAGFGELIYDDGTTNPLNGKMVREIAAYADSMMMGWLTDTTIRGKLDKIRHYYDPAVYANLNDVIWKIDSVFEGSVDTVRFGDTLQLKGTNSLLSATFLRANEGTVPARIIPLAMEIPQEPAAFTLNQNYPNPFNPTTTIGFALPVDAKVTLKIYNLLGQEVATLLDREDLLEGSQEVTFNASGMASGVYFYRLFAEGTTTDGDGGSAAEVFHQVKKMMLVK